MSKATKTKKVTKETLATLKADALRFKNEVLHTELALEKSKDFFTTIKGAKRWNDEQQINVARWIAYKWVKNKYSWIADKFLLELMNTDILKDYTNFHAFLNPSDIGGAYQEAYNIFAIVHDILLKYNVRTWSALTNEQPLATIEKLTRKTFSLGATPSVKEVEKDCFGLIYFSLNEQLKIFSIESVNSLFAETKTFENENLSAIECKQFESVFTDLYLVAKTGKTVIKSVDVSADTMSALELIATKANLTESEKLTLLFLGACKASLSGTRKLILAYSGKDYKTNDIRRYFEKAMEKLAKAGYNEQMFA